MVGARQRVVMCSHAALHVVAGRVLLFHFLLFVPAGEPLGTLFFCYTSGGTAGHSLSYCQLLLDAATVGTDHVDATNTDVGIDGFAWLDGEVSDGETTHVDDAYISFTT